MPSGQGFRVDPNQRIVQSVRHASRPMLVACQAAAAPSLERAHAARAPHVTPVALGPSQATSIVEDATGDHALRALAEEEITAAARRMVLGHLMRHRVLPDSATVVCIATAGGVRWQATFADIDPTPTRHTIR